MRNAIDRTNIKPVYLQLEDKLKGTIISGVIKPGARLPSENALSKEYGVHRHTVRKALKLLAENGVIVSKPGKGWYIKENISSHVAISACSNMSHKS